MKKILHIPRLLVAQVIAAYQQTLSPDHGWLKVFYPYGFCRCYPSCSEYAKLSILKYGVARGMVLGTARVIKCNPWAEISIDPIEQP